MYQYILAQADRVPVVLYHDEKISQERFTSMFNECLNLHHDSKNRYFRNEDVATLMKKKYGFEESVVEHVIYSPSVYPSVIEENPFQRGNVIHTKLDFDYWKENKEIEG